MGGIVDDLQTVLVGNLLYALHLHRMAIAMHGHDGCGPRRDGRFNLVRIDAAGVFFDVHKHRRTAVPPDGVGGGHETVGRGNHLPFDVECLKGCQERQGAIGEQTDVGHFQVLGQRPFQLAVELSHIGDPPAVPYLLQQSVKLVEVW